MDKKNIVCTSSILGEDMHVIAYGKKGLPVVVFPTQGQAPESLEEVGVIDELSDYLDSGTIQLFCTETVDNETWGGTGDPAERAKRQETYYHYVVDELVPLVAKMSKSTARPLALGFDAGATQASIVALRRPDLFQGCVCLSGCYDARRYFGDWMDATLYDNTPCAFLSQMPVDHPYVAVYNQRQLLFCTGQEASEADSLRSTHEMGEQLARLGVDVWCDYWGADVTHTWKKQLRYFLPIVLDDVEKTTAAEKLAKKRATTRKKAATTTAAKKTAATKAAAEKKPAAKKAATTTAKAAAEKAAAPKTAAKKATTAAEKPAAAKTTKATAAKTAATKTAAAAKTAAAEKKPAAKKAATTTAKAAEKKPVATTTVAKATKAAAPAKTTKAATPAKAVKAAAPAKAEKPAVPAKATKAAAPAKVEKAAAPAKTTAAKKPAAAKTTTKSATTKTKSAK